MNRDPRLESSAGVFCPLLTPTQPVDKKWPIVYARFDSRDPFSVQRSHRTSEQTRLAMTIAGDVAIRLALPDHDQNGMPDSRALLLSGMLVVKFRL